MRRIILVMAALGACVAIGAGAPLCYPIVPGDRMNVPANAPAFAAPVRYSGQGTLTLRQVDAGVRELERIDAGVVGLEFALFIPAPLTSGEVITLESSEPTCTAMAPVRATVSVLEAAPFPTALGAISLGAPVGFLQAPRSYVPEEQYPAVRRDVLVMLPDDALPWLSVLRVRVNGSSSPYGHLARLGVTSGTPTVVGSVVAECNRSRDVFSRPLELALEIPGYGTVPRAETTVELDCSVAPPAPGCSSVPGAALALLGLWLARRRVSARTPPR